MSGYMINREYVEVDTARRFQEAVIHSKVFVVTSEQREKIMTAKEDDRLIVASEINGSKGGIIVHSVKNYLECLKELCQ